MKVFDFGETKGIKEGKKKPREKNQKGTRCEKSTWKEDGKKRRRKQIGEYGEDKEGVRLLKQSWRREK